MPKDYEDDVEGLMRYKFQLKCRFKAIARLALFNSFWLRVPDEEYLGYDDIKKRVSTIMHEDDRGTVLKKSDKALLNKPLLYRTQQEKKYLAKKLSDLNCFKKYPHNVKLRLAEASYFKYFNPGRLLVREGHTPEFMYFILKGKVITSQMRFDGLTQKNMSVEVGILNSGDTFGDVSLLHSTKRLLSYTSAAHCEFLVLMKDDFRKIINETIQMEWDEFRRCMMMFTYFRQLDEFSIKEGCLVAKKMFFKEGSVILGDGCGVPNHVYFVITGQCQLIEQMFIIIRRGIKVNYKLFDPKRMTIKDETVLSKPSSTNIKPVESDQFITQTESTEKELKSEATLVNRLPSRAKGIMRSRPILKSSTTIASNEFGADSSTDTNIDRKVSTRVKIDTSASLASFKVKRTQANTEAEERRLRAALRELGGSLDSTADLNNATGVKGINDTDKEVVSVDDLRSIFMQVCLYNPQGCFGFGENISNRRVVALTDVECLLLPKLWLLQKNRANIWTRIQYYLEKKVPDTKQLFKTFVVERRWAEYQESLIDEVRRRRTPVNFTTLHDVPYYIRIHEILDI